MDVLFLGAIGVGAICACACVALCLLACCRGCERQPQYIQLQQMPQPQQMTFQPAVTMRINREEYTIVNR